MSKVFLVFAILIMSSCARMLGHRYQAVKFYSNAENTEVYINNDFVGYANSIHPIKVRMPLLYNLGAKKKYKVSYQADGYSELQFVIFKREIAYGVINKTLCLVDKFPGIFLLFPPIISINSGSCSSFYSEYSMALKKFNEIEQPIFNNSNNAAEEKKTVQPIERNNFTNCVGDCFEKEKKDSNVVFEKNDQFYTIKERRVEILKSTNDNEIKNKIAKEATNNDIPVQESEINKVTK